MAARSALRSLALVMSIASLAGCKTREKRAEGEARRELGLAAAADGMHRQICEDTYRKVAANMSVDLGRSITPDEAVQHPEILEPMLAVESAATTSAAGQTMTARDAVHDCRQKLHESAEKRAQAREAYRVACRACGVSGIVCNDRIHALEQMPWQNLMDVGRLVKMEPGCR